MLPALPFAIISAIGGTGGTAGYRVESTGQLSLLCYVLATRPEHEAGHNQLRPSASRPPHNFIFGPNTPRHRTPRPPPSRWQQSAGHGQHANALPVAANIDHRR
jgi:hypothetical protein